MLLYAFICFYMLLYLLVLFFNLDLLLDNDKYLFFNFKSLI